MCGPSCSACPAGAPLCASDGSGCIECFGDGNCGAEEICDGTGTCVPACSVQGCETDVTVSGDDCENAFTIGRSNALTGFGWNSTTVGSGNDSNLSNSSTACWDAKNDEAYRIYMLAGEQVNISASPMDIDFDLMLKLFQGTSCGNSNVITCFNQGYDGAQETTMYQATEDGWVTIVVDGRQAQSDINGPYTMIVSLVCNDTNCCCGG